MPQSRWIDQGYGLHTLAEPPRGVLEISIGAEDPIGGVHITLWFSASHSWRSTAHSLASAKRRALAMARRLGGTS